MSSVKGRGNRATELCLIQIFRAHRVSGWRRGVSIFGKPDFVFAASKLAVFIDGCFWHGCPLHGTLPKSNRAFWQEKLSRNQMRDKLVNRRLKALGWKTLRIWQHELRSPEKIVRRLEKFLGQGSALRRATPSGEMKVATPNASRPTFKRSAGKGRRITGPLGDGASHERQF